ncbi:DUF3990 domain-containing protein [Blautia wexlerae]|uniref:DUF3990 domain-containing protein n=1 Tax=Blautia wexlerae TaxID=418240 RepID=A0ABX2GS32_9FIRM|nr:DUF3990 domain-containing protein [Blautia wexlerae]NSF75215.1 DUF3990 domain-containing protein [Blautia wexlerae]
MKLNIQWKKVLYGIALIVISIILATLHFIVRTFAYNKDKSVQMENSDSEEWLDFILNCRSGKDSTDYDLVVGGVANDKVFNTVELFFDGLIDKTEAINRLRYEKPNLQISFRTEKALSLLHFEGSETL